MKTYPSIAHSGKAPREACHIFVKYDGSNIRFEWSSKRGWYKFGTRKVLFDESHPVFGTAIPLFKQKYADGLEQVFRTEKSFKGVEHFTVFCEWFGADSFSGEHKPEDPKEIILFEVDPYKKCFVPPKQFVETFGHLKVAECLTTTILNDEFIEQVRNGEFSVESKYEIRSKVPEGVIAKGGEKHKLWLCKIKTQSYLTALKERYKEDWLKYWE